MIQNYVKTENFKAHLIFEVRGLTRAIVVCQVLLNRNQCFDNNVFDLSHKLVSVLIETSQLFQNNFE